jgi:hypothetical protein
MNFRCFACLSALSLTVCLIVLQAPVRGAEISKFLPDDSQMVVCVNVRQILDSELVKKYVLSQIEGGIKGNTEALEMVSALGLDPVKDIASITFAAPGNVKDKKWTVLIRGNFDPAKVHAAAEKFAQNQPEALTIHSEGGLRLYEARQAKSAQPTFAALLDKENLVVSSVKDYILEAAAKSSGKKLTAMDKKLSEYVNQVDGKQSVWVVGLFPEQLKGALPLDKQTKGIVQELVALSGGVTLTDGAQAGVRIFLNDPKAARDLRQLLVGVQSLAVLAINGNDQLKDYGPFLTDILNSIKFSLDKNLVGIDLTISAQQIEKGMKK